MTGLDFIALMPVVFLLYIFVPGRKKQEVH